MRRILQIFVLFFTASILFAQPTVNGNLSDGQYTTVGTFSSGRDGFGATNNLNQLKYYSDGTDLYIGISCDLDGNNNVVLILNFSGYTGRGSGTLAGSSSSSVGAFTTGNGLANSTMDMDADFAFAFNEGSGSTNLYMDVLRMGSGASGYISANFEGNTADQTGTAASIDITSTTGGTAGNMSLAYNNGGSGSGLGIEMRIPINSFSGITSAQTLQLFAIITNNTGFLSNECVPGDPGASNLGNGGTNFTSISGQDFFTSTQALPVELTSFAANIIPAGVNLNWATATEINNFGFAVERKAAGSEWNQVAFIEGSGNSNAPKVYNYLDKNVDRTQNYQYRLKQIDNDGTFEYSHVVEANFAAPVTFNLDQNYPNPFNPSTKIRFSVQKDEHVSLQVYTIDGEKAAELFNGPASAGVNYELDFNGENLSSGVYYYKLVSASGTQVRKMLLMK